MKQVQSVSVGGVGGSQYKTIIPIASQPNVQQIQVPGSRFHYVRLVTATTASSTGQPSLPSTSTIPTGDTITPLQILCLAVSVSSQLSRATGILLSIIPGSAIYAGFCVVAKPMVVNTGAVRMSVPIVPAQTIKQVISTSVVFVSCFFGGFFYL